MGDRFLAWFSCGAASAVATKLALAMFGGVEPCCTLFVLSLCAVRIGDYMTTDPTNAELLEQLAAMTKDRDYWYRRYEETVRKLPIRMEAERQTWPHWGDRPDGFDGPQGAE